MPHYSTDKYFFEKSLEFLYTTEGGYSNHKDDRGGATNLGVTQSTYNDYRTKKNLPQKNVKDITHEESKQIYYENYWLPMNCNEIAKTNPDKALVLFDGAVNHGVGGMKNILSKYGDGDFNKICDNRQIYYTKIANNNESQKKFLEGWNNRIKNIKNFSDNKLMQTDNGDTLYNLGCGAFVPKGELETLNTGERLYPKEELNVNLALIKDIDKLKSFIKQFSNKELFTNEELDEKVKNGEIIQINNYQKQDGKMLDGYYRKQPFIYN